MNDFEVYTPDQATAEPEMSFKTDPADGPQSVARDPIYEEVSKLSVLDAAYRLWAAKRQLDASEGEPLSKRLEPTSDPFNPKVFRSLVAAAISIIGHEKQSAHEGPTLRRLLIAQPDVTEAAAKNAIRRAVHLEDGRRPHWSHWDLSQRTFDAPSKLLGNLIQGFLSKRIVRSRTSSLSIHVGRDGLSRSASGACLDV